MITFQVELPPRGLRTNSKTQHRGYRAALVREYQEAVWIAGNEKRYRPGMSMRSVEFRKPWEKAVMRLTWKHAGVAPDPDNALHSLKALIDVCKSTGPRPLGIFRDDAPDCLTIEPVQCVKVRHRVDECVIVEITEVASVIAEALQ